MGFWLLLVAVIAASSASGAPEQEYSFDRAQSFLKMYCAGCHQGKAGAGGFRLDRVESHSSLRENAQKWTSLTARVRNGEMPPKGSPAPGVDQREAFTAWVETSLRSEACAAGVVPGLGLARRLNRDEYTATIRDLLDIHMDIGRSLPADGAGGEGFDNAAETLFLSPLHSEKYMEAAKFVMDFAAREYKPRNKIFVAKPGPDLQPAQAARRIFESFLPRAFRRPVNGADVDPYVALFQAGMKQQMGFEQSVLFALRGALVSPMFLFRVETPNLSAEPRPLDQFALASRLSYFLWGSMPDELLFDVAAAGKLHEPAVLKEMVRRMIRNDRSLDFARSFVEQWLHTRELTGNKAPDPQLFPAYTADEELRSDIRLQPVLFFREMLIRNVSVLNLIDSRHTIGTINLSRHFGLDLPLRTNARKQPQWVDLPEGSRRGGLLGMPAVLAVSSHPYRTSPVLRGAWVLDSLLGTPPPPPPPDVPALDESHNAASARTVRERLTQHRANPVCGSCHDRIDPLGFALENYDVIGRWRDEDAGKPVDNSGELLDGTKFRGPDELKHALLERKDLFLRNLASKLLGYALGRGLTLQDSCAIDAIVAEVKQNDYSALTLIESIALSVPFRYQPAVTQTISKEQHTP